MSKKRLKMCIKCRFFVAVLTLLVHLTFFNDLVLVELKQMKLTQKDEKKIFFQNLNPAIYTLHTLGNWSKRLNKVRDENLLEILQIHFVVILHVLNIHTIARQILHGFDLLLR